MEKHLEDMDHKLLEKLSAMNKEELLNILTNVILKDNLSKEKIVSYLDKKQQLLTEPLIIDGSISVTSHNIVNHIILDNNNPEKYDTKVNNVKNEIIEKKNNTNKNKEKEKRKDRKQKVFSIDSYHQQQIALQIQYEGKHYLGFASQVQEDSIDNNHINNNTIEYHLFEAFIKLKLIKDRKSCNYSRCGRTDKGVNALGQIVSLRVRSAIPKDETDSKLPYNNSNTTTTTNNINNEEDVMNSNSISNSDDINNKDISNNKKQSQSILLHNNKDNIQEIDYCTMINNCLPSDIRILGWCPVTNEFDARFSAASRTYRYFFLKKNLNIINMQIAASLLVGIHDFRNLCKMDIVNVTNFKREIFYAVIKPFHSTISTTTTNNLNINDDNSTATIENNNNNNNNDDMYMFEIKGIAFLWHMVRCIMAILFMVGEGCESPTIVQSLLDIESNPCKPSYMMAPEQPLVLHTCSYDNLIINQQVKNLWQLTSHYHNLLEYHRISIARISNTLQWLSQQSVVREDMNRFIEGLLEHRDKQKKSIAIAISKYNHMNKNNNNHNNNNIKKRKMLNDDQNIVNNNISNESHMNNDIAMNIITNIDNSAMNIITNIDNSAMNIITNIDNSAMNIITNIDNSAMNIITNIDNDSNNLLWVDVLKHLSTTYNLIPKVKTIPYVPLLNRQRENAYEERVNHLSHKKKDRLDRHLSLSKAVSTETPIFFQTMRKQGSI